MRTLQLQEVEDILHGACIFGTGGGGSLSEGLDLVRSLYAEGKRVSLVPLDEVGDDWLVASPYYVGSVAPPDEEVARRLSRLPMAEAHVSTLAARALEAYLARPLQAVVATELGGNTACAIEAAISLGVPLIDADPAGRAVPDLAHTTFHIFGVSISPFALANRYGDTLIVTDTVNHGHAEQIARSFATISGNLAGVCDHPVDGRRLRQSVIPGTLSQAERVGQARRLACEEGKSPVAAVIKAGGGRLLGEGVVREARWREAGGFIEGEVIIDTGESSPAASQLSIWFRNEHMIARRGEEIVSIIPELITILDRNTGMPILNPDCQAGMEVAVLTFPAPAAWESERGLGIFGPEYIGLDRSTYPAQKE
ncbi:DUF917 domain-containing protein [Brevibacillus massiliensis]|uniref:DUF917 domain-containing protein n=1 Tax=Brevibacillus massiliensis TaxID=1118054 RepID=UPI0002F6468D|nr:DUF917 domain-containing protein [Brevibacillus massiliensis]